MASNFPTGLDGLGANNPDSTDPQTNPSHSEQHDLVNDAVDAVETKIGVDIFGASSDTLQQRIKDLEDSVGGGLTIPPGILVPYAYTIAPTGWLLCDGTSYLQSAYLPLFGIIGILYGGDGSHFNVPDLRSRVPVGKGSAPFNTVGNTGGETDHTIDASELPANVILATLGAGIAIPGAGTGLVQADDYPSGTGNAGNAFNILQPYLTIGGFIIKT